MTRSLGKTPKASLAALATLASAVALGSSWACSSESPAAPPREPAVYRPFAPEPYDAGPSLGASFADPTSPLGYTGRDWSHSKRGSLSLSMPLFDLSVESGVAGARASLLSARETRDAVLRNLDSEVRQVLLSYQEATERETLARRTVESAGENLNLIQQKYNVGSATILDLIDSQVQYQSAQSSLVSALAAIRVAEASLDRVRGRSE